MKKINILTTAFLAGAVLALSSCTEEKIVGIDPNGIPVASDYDIQVTVDQETNQYTLNLVTSTGNPAMGVYPIWKIYTAANPVQSTRNGYSSIVTVAGDYDVELQVGNHNGVSEGVKTGSIHIENTIINFTPYINNLTGEGSKVWHIDGNTAGHLGCGESGTDGLNWWSANPGDKAAEGVYDNLMTFTSNGETDGTGLYTYDPGESGTIYVNKDVTVEPYASSNPHDDNDFRAPAEVQENIPFKLYAEGADLMLSFPEGTLLGYLPNDDLYYEPKFKVLGISRNKIELVCDNGGIAWHYILAPFEKEEIFEGFKYDSEFNMWKDAEVVLQETWFSPSDWSGSCQQPEVELSNSTIKFHTPADMGNDQWMGQVHIGTNIAVSSAETYDFSCIITADTDIKATVKVQKDGDDNVSFAGQDQISFAAGGDVYYFSDLQGFDGNLKIAFDFAGNPDMDITISKIVFKNHKDDDGTVLPSDNPDPELPEETVIWVSADSEANIWNSKGVATVGQWTANNDWAEITAPTITEGDNEYTLVYSEAPGVNQWQAQFKIETDLSFPGDKVYDFRVTINPTCDIAGVTVKPTNYGDDIFWSEGRHDVYANEDNVIELKGVSADMSDFKIVFDFAGVEAGATVVVKDIIIQEHKVFSWVDTNSEANIWNSKGVATVGQWTANNDWAEITAPTITEGDNEYTLVYSEAPGVNQWQAQFKIETDLSFPGDKVYDFRVTINPTCDIAGVTVKPTNYGDDVFWSEGRHDVYANEDNVIELKGVSADMSDFKIVFDFAGVEAGATVVVKDIIIQEH